MENIEKTRLARLWARANDAPIVVQVVSWALTAILGTMAFGMYSWWEQSKERREYLNNVSGELSYRIESAQNSFLRHEGEGVSVRLDKKLNQESRAPEFNGWKFSAVLHEYGRVQDFANSAISREFRCLQKNLEEVFRLKDRLKVFVFLDRMKDFLNENEED